MHARQHQHVVPRPTRIVPAIVLAMVVGAVLPRATAAATMTEDGFQTAVQTWVRKLTAGGKGDAVVSHVDTCAGSTNGRAVVTHLAGGGYCVGAADDRLVPVTFYCPGGTYDPDDPFMEQLGWEIERRIAWLDRQEASGRPWPIDIQAELDRRRTLWSELRAGRVPPRDAREPLTTGTPPDRIVLPLTSLWHQGSADANDTDQYNTFNGMCPEVPAGSGERCRVGCPATAASQLMRYWQWPIRGTGSSSTTNVYQYTPGYSHAEVSCPTNPFTHHGRDPAAWPWTNRLEWSSGNLRMKGYWDWSLLARATSKFTNFVSEIETLYASNVFTEASDVYGVVYTNDYQWKLMRDTWLHTDPVPNEEEEAMQLLCYDVGVGLHTEYGLRNSGADTKNQISAALYDHFFYSADSFWQESDIQTMLDEIRWFRPMVRWGSKPGLGGGHAWLCHGYDLTADPTNPQFYMNLGWNGDENGWYTLDGIKFNEAGHGSVVMLAPRNVVFFVGGGNPGDGSPDSPFPDIETALSLVPDNSTLVFKAGEVNTFSANILVLDRPMTLKGVDVVIREQ